MPSITVQSSCLILLLAALLLPLYAAAEDSPVCEGAGLFAMAGAIYRDKHFSFEEADRAVIEHAHNADSDELRFARFYSASGYKSSLTPDAAYTWAKAHCLRVMHKAAEHSGS
jgi:hypothetical protein